MNGFAIAASTGSTIRDDGLSSRDWFRFVPDYVDDVLSSDPIEPPHSSSQYNIFSLDDLLRLFRCIRPCDVLSLYSSSSFFQILYLYFSDERDPLYFDFSCLFNFQRFIYHQGSLLLFYPPHPQAAADPTTAASADIL
jgi:hypothetical protein